MTQRIIVVGSANVDFIMKLSRLPAIGETVTEGDFMQTFGGKGANQALAATRAGGEVMFIAGVGDDSYGQVILENFRKDGMNVENVHIAPNTPTGSALVMFDQKGDNYLGVAAGANYALLPEHIEALADSIAGAAMVVMQMEIPAATLQKTLDIASANGVPVLFNFAPAKTKDLPLSDAMQILVVNEVEAEALTGLKVLGEQEAFAAAALLREQGPQIVIVTLGAQGACYLSAKERGHAPAFSVVPVDTTAAGDVFCGVLAVALAEGQSLSDAVRFASAASALSVTRMGAQPSVPYRTEIEAFLRDQTL